MRPTTPGKRGASLAERLVEAFAGEIRGGALRPGQKLPTEAETVARFGVSRTVVREALSRLQAAGLVETRHGIGTFVAVKGRDGGLRADAAEIAAVIDLVALLELRIGLESEAAAIAARRRTDAQAEAMARALDRYAAELEAGRDTAEADFAFHKLIAEATDNRYYMTVLAAFGPKAIPHAGLKNPGMAPEASREYLSRVNREHRDILDAIVRGDPDGARAAMRNHIGNGRERLKQRQKLSDNRKDPRRKP